MTTTSALLRARPGDRPRRGATRSLVAGGAAVLAVALGAGALLGAGWFGNPFGTTTIDRSPAPIVTELRDLASLHAAQASFEVIVDREDDVHLVPQFIAGERVQFVAVGTVDAVVDLTGIAARDVAVGADGTSVVITLPPVELAAPVIDHDRSHVMNRDRGVLDRLGGAFTDSPTGEQELFLAAEAQMADAAAQTDLVARAEASATATLTALVEGLGYDDVAVTFAR